MSMAWGATSGMRRVLWATLARAEWETLGHIRQLVCDDDPICGEV